MKNKSIQVKMTSLLLLVLLSGCIMVPKKEMPKIGKTNSRWSTVDVSIELAGLDPNDKAYTKIQDRYVSIIEQEHVFKSVNQTETAIKLNFKFIRCKEGPGALHVIWFSASVASAAIIPYLTDSALCLDVASDKLPKTLRFIEEYTILQSIVVALGGGIQTFDNAMRPIEHRLIMQFLAYLTSESNDSNLAQRK